MCVMLYTKLDMFDLSFFHNFEKSIIENQILHNITPDALIVRSLWPVGGGGKKKKLKICQLFDQKLIYNPPEKKVLYDVRCSTFDVRRSTYVRTQLAQGQSNKRVNRIRG